MKHLLIIMALCVLLKPVLPVLEYAIHYEYIIKELCENKAQPQLHCNGTCHLKKELAKASETEKSDKKETAKQHTEILFYQSNDYVWQFYPIILLLKPNVFYKAFYGYCKDYFFFHPPI